MALPVCVGVVPLSLQGYWLGGINGCSPLRQGKRYVLGIIPMSLIMCRKLELGEAQIKTRQPMKQNSESVYQPRRFNLSCKSVQTITPAAVAGFRILDGTENPTTSIKERVEKLVSNQRALLADVELKKQRPLDLTLLDQFHGNYIPKSDLLKVAYDHCREIFVKAEESLSFGSYETNSRDMSKKSVRFAGIQVGGTLHRWEQSTLDAFQGRPWNIYDVALSDTVSKFPLEIQFLVTYTWDFFLDSARMGRIYLPQDELLAAGLSDDDVFRGKVTDKWRKFMKGQIERAGVLLDEGSSLVIQEMNADVGWAFWALTIIGKENLDVIEANDYETFTRKTSVGKPKILLNLLLAYAKSLGLF
ncbi:hypothetical protein RHGRI_032816 [Rhododendron griersonianum]|uniref:15-cis-phytoene synthase n=1 Tax=Rhododendron griersonianum TaxID=479676 RepID=A0AAV6ID97_9ERIC|nr:hypothetical protein RHGRI_032816 [Rhododendron griersonianum]